MSHKTLYIDIDEEITSIIDRVRRAAANEIIIVAPKRALLLQSLVNLKLLKKELERHRKKLMIVTQDRLGKKLIEKAGILVQGKIDEAMDNFDDREFLSFSQKADPRNNLLIEEIGEEKEEDEKEIGSDRYFDEPFSKKPAEKKEENIGQIVFEDKKALSAEKRKVVSRQRTGGIEKKLAEKAEGRVRMSDIVASSGSERKTRRKSEKTPNFSRKKVVSLSKTTEFFEKTDRSAKMTPQINRFFNEKAAIPRASVRQKEKILKTGKVHGKMPRLFLYFSLVFAGLAAVGATFFALPKAKIIIFTKGQEKNAEIKIEANLNANEINREGKIIPAALEQATFEKTEEFEASGRKSGGGKAMGTIVVYNEFSQENQPLVATTRFETSDGKIFRITKSIVVPGMSKAGGETSPGAVEAEVTADKPGEEYNIEPTEFRITGFKGGPKYEKFYAKSAKAMTGGAQGESPAVTAQDIAEAKEKLAAESKKEVVKKLQNSLPPDRKFFENTATVEILSSVSSAGVGVQTEKFSLTVKTKAQDLSFAQADVEELIKSQIAQEGNLVDLVKFKNPVNYILSEKNSDNTLLRFEAKADLDLAGGISVENFKKGALGKNASELEALVKNYPAIQKIDVNFWPFFASRVPLRESRVEIEVR